MQKPLAFSEAVPRPKKSRFAARWSSCATTINKAPPTGPMTVMAFMDGKPRRVQITLDEPSHRVALQAYDRGAEITCLGDLVKSGTSFVLQNAKGFAIVSDE